MIEKTASVHWEGPGKTGKGTVSTETGAIKDYPYTAGTRFEGERTGTNPEEILGAAHAACFTMAFAFACEKAGHSPSALDTKATVHLAKQSDGFMVQRIALELDASVPGIDDTQFQELAQAAKLGCPISKALASVPEIVLKATLRR